MNEVFDEYGNYIYPTDVVLEEPNTVIGCIPTMVYPQVDGITPTVVAVKKSFRDTWEQTE